ncbi:MAG TPA: sigma-70 family RNA polymerase sigma factor [Sphingomicrobium sp.]|nr:sigma-70 family RNA polymerase sigma factor [Sphingomicrobium sp.]
MTRPPRGLDLLVRPERAEALLWWRLRFEKRQEAREPLFNRYAGFARSIAQRVRSWGEKATVKDAEQWAYTGLLQAIDTFDPLHGSRFEAFAKPRIAGSVRDGFAQASELEAQWTYRRKQERDRLRSLKERKGSEAKDPIEALGEIAACLAVGLMLDGTRLMGGDEAPDPGPSAYESLAWRQTQLVLEREISRLAPSEASVIQQHYVNGLSFTQVAELMGVTRGRISQLHRAALAKLRKRMSREY